MSETKTKLKLKIIECNDDGFVEIKIDSKTISISKEEPIKIKKSPLIDNLLIGQIVTTGGINDQVNEMLKRYV